ncbi:hypothetical protein ACFQZR_12210 [Paenibacillus sp. GCM10027629]|uniref:hypothetical protein n=1 Tax=Paenibacillus sp. GCM10027629 TaxID=3273414 RepID=UPI00362AA8D6
MVIYCFMFEAIPKIDNPERDEFAGAYVTCWVNSTAPNSALTSATAYINDEGWEVMKVEDQFIASREQYEGDDELAETLECFDQAVNYGIAAIFHTWTLDD